MKIRSNYNWVKFFGYLQKYDFVSLVTMITIASLPWGLKVNTCFILLLVATVVFKALKNRLAKKIDYKILAIGTSLYLVSLLWMANTSNWSEGLSYLERTLSGLVFPLLFMGMYCFGILVSKKLVFSGFVLSCLLRYLFLVFQIIEFELIFIWDYWLEVLPQFNQLSKELDLHPTYYSMYLGFASILCLWLGRMFGMRKGFYGLSFILFILNITMAAKMPLIAFLLVYPVVLFKELFNDTISNKKKYFGAIAILGTIVCLLFLFKLPDQLTTEYNNYKALMDGGEKHDLQPYKIGVEDLNMTSWSKTNRIFIWKSSITAITENLLCGTGTGDLNDELNYWHGKYGQQYLSEHNVNTHNQFLDFGLRFGLMGIIILSYFAILLINALSKGLNYSILTFLFFFFLICLTENLLNRQMGVVFFHFFFNFFFVLDKEEKS